jgi:hypothetical protein
MTSYSNAIRQREQSTYIQHCEHYCGSRLYVTEIRNKIVRLYFSVEDYKHRGPGFDSWALLRIFLRELGLERGPLSLVIG